MLENGAPASTGAEFGRRTLCFTVLLASRREHRVEKLILKNGAPASTGAEFVCRTLCFTVCLAPAPLGPLLAALGALLATFGAPELG